MAKSLASLSDSFGSAFNFDFVRNPSRPKRLPGRNTMGSWKLRSPESSPVEPNGSKASDMRLQGQQEELLRMQQEQARLQEELTTQKVQLFVRLEKEKCVGSRLSSSSVGKLEYLIFSCVFVNVACTNKQLNWIT